MRRTTGSAVETMPAVASEALAATARRAVSGASREATPPRRAAPVRTPARTARALTLVCGLLCLVASLPSGSVLAAAAPGDGIPLRAARAAAPSFALPDGDGAVVRLEALRGKVVYVDFWASWCTPCLQSFPWMSTLAERFAGDGLQVVAINLDAERAAAARFLADTRADFDVLFDPSGTSAEAFGLAGMPSSYVIDRDGRIAYTHVGFRRRDAAAIEAAVAAVLAEDAGTSLRVAASEEDG